MIKKWMGVGLIVAIASMAHAQTEPGTLYYNSALGTFGLGTKTPQTFLHLKNPNPIITLMSTSAGQLIDADGSNNGWAGISFMTPAKKGANARLVWDLLYSARDNQLYLMDYTSGQKRMVLANGLPVSFLGGLVVNSGDIRVSDDKAIRSGLTGAELIGRTTAGTITIGSGVLVDQLVLRSGGISRVFLTPSGNVGIGTTVPSYTLDLVTSVGQRTSINGPTVYPNTRYWGQIVKNTNMTDGTAIGYAFFGNDTGGTERSAASIDSIMKHGATHLSADLAFSVGNGANGFFERMRIASSGNVGIGTTAPAERLDVLGNVKATQFIGDGSRLTGISNGFGTTMTAVGNRVGIGTAAPLESLDVSGNVRATQFIGDGSRLTGISNGLGTAMTVSGNNVGIGTTQPTQRLQISVPESATTVQTFVGGLETAVNTSGGWARSTRFRNLNDNSTVAFGGWSGNAFIATGFNPAEDSTGYTTSRLTITATGRIGIGTNGPSESLDVSGNVRATQFIGDGSRLTGILGGSGSPLMVSSNGNIGIGIQSPASKLHIVGNARIEGVLQANDIVIPMDTWADKVFDPDYELMALTDVARFIAKSRHLPGVPSEAEVKANGINIATMQTIHMQKIEELTRYVIQLNEALNTVQLENQSIRQRLEAIEARLESR